MTVDDVAHRLLNPVVLGTMLVAGVAYGWLLWSLNIRPHFRLWAAATFPGLIFLAVVWSIRASQGVSSLTYIALGVDWLLFANAGYLAVLVHRWMRKQ